MSKLQELIQRLCPDGVEYKPLGEVGTFTRSNGLQKKDFTDSGVGCIHYGQIYTYYGTFAYETKSFVSSQLAGKLRKASCGDLVIATTSENIEDVCKAVAWLGCEDIAVGSDAFIFHHSLNPKYVAYFFQTEWFQRQKRPVVTGTKVMRVSKNALENMVIPVPPMEVQEEIVKILDRFTDYLGDYVVDLQAEIRARKQQYEYYSNLLFAFRFSSVCYIGIDDEQQSDVIIKSGRSYEIKWKKLGEIGTFMRGNGLQKKDFTDSGVGCIHYGQIYTCYDAFAVETKSFVSTDLSKRLLKVNPGDLIIACTSENVEDVGKAVAWLGNNEIVTGGHSAVFRHTLNPKYVAYFFQTQMFSLQKKKIAYGTKIIDLKTEDLAKMIIPVPPLELQERIVAVLERFSVLVNKLNEGLLQEIELRRKRYEYYRNRLLSFTWN